MTYSFPGFIFLTKVGMARIYSSTVSVILETASVINIATENGRVEKSNEFDFGKKIKALKIVNEKYSFEINPNKSKLNIFKKYFFKNL